MNVEIQNVLARNEGWQQLIPIVVVVALAILKKVFSAVKDYSEQHRDASDADDSAYEEKPEHKQSYHATHTYDKDAFKTIEQIRNEKAAAIRARYGIPEPRKAPPAPMEPEPEMVEQIPAEPIRERMFTPPPVPRKPVYIPPVPKKKPITPPPSQQENVYHPAYAQPQAKPSAPQMKKSKHPEAAAETHNDTLISFASPQDLRAAILYQEILGKPLALRD
jgi:hypothetical protein